MMRNLLIIPTVFLMLLFIYPITSLLTSSVYNTTVSTLLPQTTNALKINQTAHDEFIYDLSTLDRTQVGRLANYLNKKEPNTKTLIISTFNNMETLEEPYNVSLTNFDKRWGEQNTWDVLKRESNDFTITNYVQAFDYSYTDNRITPRPTNEQIYTALLWKTIWVSLLVATITLLLSYPVSFLLVKVNDSVSNIVMFCVLLPLWTSVLTRVVAWVVLLQNNGVINNSLKYFGMIESSLPLMHNLLGTVIVTTYIFLPFMILPLYVAMKNIPLDYIKIAETFGMTHIKAFWKVYFPLTIQGALSGVVLVFIMCLGYFITPEIMGGTTGQFISTAIVFNIVETLNWGLAATLSSIILIIVIILFIILQLSNKKTHV